MGKKMLFKAAKTIPLEKGAAYQRRRNYDLIERAVVEWVGEDATGIPHVRYVSNILGSSDKSDTRFLAQSEFIKQYAPCGINA